MSRQTMRTALKDVELTGVHFVGKGDNKGANILLLKTHPNPIVALGKEYKGDNKSEMLQKWFDSDVSKADGIFKEEDSVMFADLLQDKEIRDKVWGMVWILEDSICSILNGEDADKSSLIQTTVEQFKTAITALTKNEKGGNKSMDELQKAQEELAKANVRISELEGSVATLTKERDEAIAKSEPPKETIDKSQLPEAVVKQLETLEKTNKENAEAIKKMKDEAVTTEMIAKSAEIGAISAEGVVVHEVLKSIKKASEDTFGKLMTLLKAADARIKEAGLFKEQGGEGRTTGLSAHEQIVAKAIELKKSKPHLSDAQAYTEVYNSDIELRKQYLEENRSK